LHSASIIRGKYRHLPLLPFLYVYDETIVVFFWFPNLNRLSKRNVPFDSVSHRAIMASAYIMYVSEQNSHWVMSNEWSKRDSTSEMYVCQGKCAMMYCLTRTCCFTYVVGRNKGARHMMDMMMLMEICSKFMNKYINVHSFIQICMKRNGKLWIYVIIMMRLVHVEKSGLRSVSVVLTQSQTVIPV